MKKFHQLTLNLFNEPTATQLILDFAEEELICVIVTRDNHSPPKPAFLLFRISDVIASCRRERKTQYTPDGDCCNELMIRGCIDEMRVGTHTCAGCYGNLIKHDIYPQKVATHPMNFITEEDRH